MHIVASVHTSARHDDLTTAKTVLSVVVAFYGTLNVFWLSVADNTLPPQQVHVLSVVPELLHLGQAQFICSHVWT